jgi:hypothetical protein
MVVKYTQSARRVVASPRWCENAASESPLEETFAMTTSNLRPVAAHVLRHLARAQSRGRAVRLDQLAGDIGVSQEDVREVVTSLHAEGHVDAKRMRLTLTGFAIAASMRECKLRSVRVYERPSQINVA